MIALVGRDELSAVDINSIGETGVMIADNRNLSAATLEQVKAIDTLKGQPHVTYMGDRFQTPLEEQVGDLNELAARLSQAKATQDSRLIALLEELDRMSVTSVAWGSMSQDRIQDVKGQVEYMKKKLADATGAKPDEDLGK